MTAVAPRGVPLAAMLALCALLATPALTRAPRMPARGLPVVARGPLSRAIGRDDDRFWATAKGASIVAANRPQRLSARFSRSGAVFSTRYGTVSLALQAYGSGAALEPSRAASPEARRNRVSFGRGPLVEWYVNGPLGVEQGFDLRAPPPRARAGELTLALRVGGSLRPRLSRDGVRFLDARGRAALRYRGVEATDARGRSLHASLALRHHALLLRVDDAHARYPLRIDPFVQQGSKLTPSDETGNGNFGYDVALSADGNTALIGGPVDNSDAGAAWLFTRSGTTWSQEGSKLTPSDATGNSRFGWRVALSGDGNTALIGGVLDNSGAGAAWAFTRSGSTWAQQGSKLTPSDETGNGNFGSAVALSSDGNTALIGGLNDGASPLGAAWAFTRSGTSWAQQGLKLTPSDAIGKGNFGSGVALSSDGNTGLIGAPFDGMDGQTGAAWVFTRSGSTWSQQGSKLTGSGETGGGEFGTAVALSSSGDTAAVGAPFDASSVGATWVFTRSGSTWSPQGPKLAATDESGSGQFGKAVAVSSDGNLALIGGYLDNGTYGAVWEFNRSGATWSQEGSKLTPNDETAPMAFGFSVALSSDATTGLVGGPGSAGAAWAFAGPGGPPPGGPPPGGPPLPPGGGAFEVPSHTTITSGPSGFTASAPRFTFVSDITGATFECQFDGAPFLPCTTPHTVYNLPGGPHTFNVRSVAPSGAAEATPASRSFTLGKTTKHGSCTFLIPWSLQFVPPGAPLEQQFPDCTALTDTCPDGSLCTLAVRWSVTDADDGLAWGSAGHVLFNNGGFGVSDRGDFCDSPSSYSRSWLDKDWRSCPGRVSLNALGPDDRAVAHCGPIYYARAATTQRGPDDQRRVTCDATLTVVPAPPLRVVAQGAGLAVVAPGPGVLGVAAAGAANLRIVAAARPPTRKAPPPFKAISRRVTRAGQVTFKLKLSKAAARTLRRRYALTLKIRITFTGPGGQRTVKTQTVALNRSCPLPRVHRGRKPKRCPRHR